ncbi:MAG TPA: hypothetical protein PLD54_05140, partial [Candidatus Levybacteria bacterium]|nr:hypothetical protein [Candidatus Levybacteria bacterium]
TPYFKFVGEASPSNSPSSGDNVIGRAIGDIDAVVDHILVPQGSWSLYSDALYEDWISGNYVRTSNGTQLAYYDPHFAVFGPSRFFWSGDDANSYGISRNAQDKADNVGRSVDVCYMSENSGAQKARGGECEYMTNYGQINTMAWDDPRSAFNGVKREFYFNNMGVSNTGSNTIWYADPFGNNAQTAPFTGSVKHYLKPKDTPGNYQYPFESNAIGANRNYGGNNVHAPN